MEKRNLTVRDVTLILSILAIILSLMSILSCQKQNQKLYYINNLGAENLSITTPEDSYVLENPKTLKFFSSEMPKFSYENYKVNYWNLGTSPQITITVTSYLYDFEVEVTGLADSVEIIINGTYYKEKIPFYYGTGNIPNSYNVVSRPNKQENVYTTVYRNGNCIDIDEGNCNLSGRL